MVMCFNEDPKEILKDAERDLRTIGCSIFWNPCQHIDIINRIACMGVPNLIEAALVQNVAKRALWPLEREIVIKINNTSP